MNHLQKKYGNKLAVQDVSFGVNFGECFALLGVNGAGKTTTFKSLTNEVKSTYGELHIGGYSIDDRVGFSHARWIIGYCP